LGEVPWEGSPCAHKLSEELVFFLHNNKLFSLQDTSVLGVDVIDRMEWISIASLCLEGKLEIEWRRLVEILKSNFINLQEDEAYSLCW
jgi:hypothetical protein